MCMAEAGSGVCEIHPHKLLLTKLGDKNHDFYGAPFMGDAYAKRGYLCITIGYRLSCYPENVEDVARYESLSDPN